MQIILLDKVVNLGNLGDVVKVKPGYARNFLIPQGKAKRATQDNLAAFEARRAELERVAAEKLAAAQAEAAKVDGLTVQIVRKADVAEALETQGVKVEKSAVRMPEGPIKAVGDSQLQVALHTDVVVSIT